MKCDTHILQRINLNIITITHACCLSVEFLNFQSFENKKNIYIFKPDWNLITHRVIIRKENVYRTTFGNLIRTKLFVALVPMEEPIQKK